MGFIHSMNVCQKEVIAFNRLWEEFTQEEARLIIRETKDKDLKKIPQLMRNMKESILEEPLINLSISIRNDTLLNK